MEFLDIIVPFLCFYVLSAVFKRHDFTCLRWLSPATSEVCSIRLYYGALLMYRWFSYLTGS